MLLVKIRPLAAMALLAMALPALAQGPGAAPPAKVVTAEAVAGQLVPTAEFEGTVYYKEVSAVATEVDGLVLSVAIDAGDRLQQGDLLVSLNADILKARLVSTKALLAQREALLRQEQARYERAALLVEEEVTTQQEFDDIRFTRDAVAQQVESARAEVALLDLQIAKKAVYAPFDGVVMHRHAEVGEWLPSGAQVATIARSALYDVMVYVPERFLPFVQPGASVEMGILSSTVTGTIVPGSPEGDISTRTFPVRIRLTEPEWLQAGMAATARMATGPEQACALVPRDAILLDGGRHFVVLASDGTAVRQEVTVLGYAGAQAGVPLDVIPPGTQVITKGHERLRPGQPIQVAGS